MNYINIRIKQLLSDFDLSQKQLAEKLSTTPAVISRWINGVSTPNVDSIKHICEALNIPFTYFQENNSNQSNMMLAFNDLAMLYAVNKYLEAFCYVIRCNPDDNFVLEDDQGKAVRTISKNELSYILFEINQTINEKVFYSHKKNYLKISDLKPLSKEGSESNEKA